MALTVALLGAVTFNTNAGDKTVVATPTLGDMIIVIVAQTGFTAAAVADNNADGHGSYTSAVSALKSTSADQLAAFVRADPVRSGTATTFTATQTGSTGGGLAVFRVAGATIAGAAFIRNTGGQSNQAAGTAASPMGSAVLTTNALIAAFLDTTNAAPTLTVPAGFAASDVNTNYNTPGTGLQITHQNSGNTSSTITWGTAAPSAFCDIALELRANIGDGKVGDQEDITHTRQTAAKRGALYCLGDMWVRRGRVLVPKLWTPEPAVLAVG